MTTQARPIVHDGHISFRVHDPEYELVAVRLAQEVARPRLGPDFIRFANSDWWELNLPRPEADRMEYQLELSYREGTTELVCDPSNPLRAPGAFGPKSVLEFPEYSAPTWLGNTEEPKGEMVEAEIRSRALRSVVPVQLWSSEGIAIDEPAPLLIVHDGPEYARYSKLLQLLAVTIDAHRLPSLRAALLQPVERKEIYSASAPYARALAHEVVPALARLAPTPHGRRFRVGMGASLGALSMLHAHRKNPAVFGALYLQSGSYFRQRTDRHESAFPRFRRTSRFVGQVLAAGPWPHPIPVTLTCGTAEENLSNNRAVAAALERQGYDIVLHENRDAHNWVGWRDTFDPHLVNLLERTWT